MKIHEYQGKEILRKFNVPTPVGGVAFSVDEAVKVAQNIGRNIWVVKAQIHAGGRGKGGGVKVAKSLDEVRQLASQILGMRLITHQTSAEGRIVKRLLIEQGISIAKELYVGITLDRARSQNVVMSSTEGGVEIEKVAAETPELIFKEWIDPTIGFRDYQARKLAFALKLEGDAFKNGVKFLLALYKAYEEMDASLVEINPFVITTDGKVLALDAKMTFDDNALFRNPEILEMRDLEEEEPLEIEASKYNLNYIKLDGKCWLYGKRRWTCNGNYGYHKTRGR
jgi:succinyl-CoA synthetase beta subunit